MTIRLCGKHTAKAPNCASSETLSRQIKLLTILGSDNHQDFITSVTLNSEKKMGFSFVLHVLSKLLYDAASNACYQDRWPKNKKKASQLLSRDMPKLSISPPLKISVKTCN